MKRIVIADHHPTIRKGIACLLKKSDKFTIVGNVKNGNELYEKLKNKNPDILILEIDMPKTTGINELRGIRNLFPHIQILIFSTHPEEIYALRSIKYGAAGYVSKTASNKVFLKALKQISKGGIFLNKQLTAMLSDNKTRKKNNVNSYDSLSSREIEVLQLLSSGKRNKDIASVLKINEKTVSTYKTRILKKLNLNNLADIIHQTRLFQDS